MIIYGILQVKSGSRLLKSDETKQKMSFVADFVFLFAFIIYIAFVLLVATHSRLYTCDNKKAMQEAVIPLLDETVSKLGIKAVSYSDTKEISYDSKSNKRVCHATVLFSNSESAIIEYMFVPNKLYIKIVEVLKNK